VSLTGPWFFGLVVIVAVAGFVAAVYWWPRMAGSSALAVAARAGTLLGLNLVMMLTAAIALNNQFTFFADWTDLAGALGRTQTFTTAHGGASASDAASAPLPDSLPIPGTQPALPVLPSAGERVLRYTITGPISGIRGSVEVELPVGYADPANRTRQYPVLETFHGYPGDISSWVDGMNLGTAVSAAVNARKVSDMVTVSPTLEVPPGVDTECVNSPKATDPQMETWLTQDVPNWLVKTFRVRTDRESWATMGLSMGGWCAAMAAMLHPDRYAAAVVLGGYFQPSFGKLYAPFTAKSPFAQRYDLVRLAQTDPPPVALWVQTSHSDPLSYPSASQLLKQARPPLSVTSLVLAHAGHRVSLWQGLLPQTLTWLGTNIPGFRPVG
jgi:S-formylglutathione hydrolase FrmB